MLARGSATVATVLYLPMDQQERIRMAASLLQQAVEQQEVEPGQSIGRSRSTELQAVCKATSSSVP